MGFVEWPWKHLLRDIQRTKPDWIFLTGSRAFPPEKLLELSNIAKLAIWDADAVDESRDEHWKEIASIPNLVITSVKDVENRYKSICNEIHWIPQFFDSEYYNVVPALNSSQYDICFIGNLLSASGEDPRRKEFLNILSNKFNLIHFGTTERSPETVLYDSRMTQIYTESKISFDIKREAHYRPGEFMVSDRIFKAMGCGTFFISYPVEGLDKVFKEGEHLVTYNGELEDLIDKITYYLDNEEIRAKIALQGQQEIFKNHTLKVRIPQYWELLK